MPASARGDRPWLPCGGFSSCARRLPLDESRSAPLTHRPAARQWGSCRKRLLARSGWRTCIITLLVVTLRRRRGGALHHRWPTGWCDGAASGAIRSRCSSARAWWPTSPQPALPQTNRSPDLRKGVAPPPRRQKKKTCPSNYRLPKASLCPSVGWRGEGPTFSFTDDICRARANANFLDVDDPLCRGLTDVSGVIAKPVRLIDFHVFSSISARADPLRCCITGTTIPHVGIAAHTRRLRTEGKAGLRCWHLNERGRKMLENRAGRLPDSSWPRVRSADASVRGFERSSLAPPTIIFMVSSRPTTSNSRIRGAAMLYAGRRAPLTRCFEGFIDAWRQAAEYQSDRVTGRFA